MKLVVQVSSSSVVKSEYSETKTEPESTRILFISEKYFFFPTNIIRICVIFVLDKLETVEQRNRKPLPLFKLEYFFLNILKILVIAVKTHFLCTVFTVREDV